MKQVDFYFDFISPYVWLASHQLREVRECTAARYRFVPVLFAALLDHHSNLGPAEIPAKRCYTFQDAQRWAVYLGLEFKSPPAHPLIPLKALRATSAIDNDDLREALAVRLLDAAWSEVPIVLFKRSPIAWASTGNSFWTRPTPMRSSRGFVFKRRLPFRQGCLAFQAL